MCVCVCVSECVSKVSERGSPLGQSIATDRSIGLATENGTITNTGTVSIGSATIDGKYGIALYTKGTGKIDNSAIVSIIGDETTGAFATGTSNINLTAGGNINIKGKKATAYYLDAGTNSKIDSGVGIAIEGNETTGVFVNSGKLKYEGDTTVRGNGLYGLVANKNTSTNYQWSTSKIEPTIKNLYKIVKLDVDIRSLFIPTNSN